MGIGTGTTLQSRFGQNNVPFELLFGGRFTWNLAKIFPWLLQKKAEGITRRANAFLNHEHHGLSSKSTPIPLHGGPMMINDELKHKLLYGLIKCRGQLERLTENSAVFTDGSEVENVDVVLFATGYNFSLSFVDDNVLRSE